MCRIVILDLIISIYILGITVISIRIRIIIVHGIVSLCIIVGIIDGIDIIFGCIVTGSIIAIIIPSVFLIETLLITVF